MRLESFSYNEAAGVFEPLEERIVIKRTQLKDLKAYAGTLLHEVGRARAHASDASVEFEAGLTIVAFGGPAINNLASNILEV